MRKLIGEHYPEHGIVGEEYGREREDAEFVWVLDPIDGTRSFITGLPLWGVLIGLLRNGKPVLGMMAQPFTGERFVGDGERPGSPTAAAVHRLADAAVREPRRGGAASPPRRSSSPGPTATPMAASRAPSASPATAPTATATAWSRPAMPTSSSKPGCSPTTSSP